MTWVKQYKMRVIARCVCLALLLLFICSQSVAEEYVVSKGQTVYVPVYSNIYSSPKKVPIHLANILSIRNTDMAHGIRITAVDYYDTKGTLVKKHYAEAVTMAPLESAHIYLSNRADEGGLGANFIVKWEAAKEVNAPIIECVMAGSEGRAFVTSGRVIKDPVN
jgi:hypothetical protein